MKVEPYIQGGLIILFAERFMAEVLFFVPAAVVLCFLLQRRCRRSMEMPQYNYFRDLLLVAAWVLAALWAGSSVSRFIVGMAAFASLIGTCQHIRPHWGWKTVYLFVGLLFAFFGPKIGFIGLPDGQYHYFSPEVSIIATALWVGVFPVLLQQLDNIPGMAGHLLAVSFSLLLLATVFSGQDLPDAFFMSLCGLAFLGVFWSRHGHMYRRMGESLSAFWGVLVAGTSVLGVSKGITFSTLLLLPLGLFAIPIMEASLHFAGLAFSSKPHGAAVLYRKLISRGLDHPSAVRFITSLCALGGAVIAISQLGNSLFMMLWVSATILFTGLAIMPFIRKMKENAEMPLKPSIWSTSVDNVSMDYALAKTRAAALSGKGVSLVSTVNALAVMEAEKNRGYADALRSSFLTLADGAGLVWALRFLGTPVQERVAGIDFMMRLTRMAAAERLPVYLLGAKEEAVKGAAETLKEQYPDLVIAGWRNGYFDPCDASVAGTVRASGAKILFVAMGVPRQEIWIRENARLLGDMVAVGVGGAFDVVSGQLRRAPGAWQKLGLEWLFRLLQEPWRWKRDIDLFIFVCRVFLTKLGLRPFREDRSAE